MTTYPLLMTLRIVRKRQRVRLAIVAERHGLALGRYIGKRKKAA